MAQDYYEVLGVPRTAGDEEIQQAYRKLARRHHPDINKDPRAEERFKEVNEAYGVLSDPDTRARYDRFGPDFRKFPGSPGDYDERVAAAAGRGPGGRASTGGGWTAPGGGTRFAQGTRGAYQDVDFEDLFSDLFGGAGRGGGRGNVPGADQEAELELTVEEAYRGGRRAVGLAGPDGRRDYQVTVPRGVTDGQRIRLAGEGGRGGRDAPAGDLYLRVRIRPHDRYRLEGHDIHVRLPVTPWEAALGATVPLPTPGGTAKVTVPPGSSSGRRLRLRGEGMPRARGTDGDLYAELRVMVPPRPTDRERELFEELAAASDFDPRRPG
ncbi:DnaJ C-terminal domain-containing protein [Streptomyces sp. NBC_00872]|uniref:DnaJ C-terminal domain-containing protein n=1 Tax=Streptomyces sp. NBC_00872 TaxID=2903686 RepID=UPI00386918AC|nr:J domain-containing protein [Streptomyces sp. NBC_00872]